MTGLRRLVSQTVHEEARISSRRYEQRACLTTEALGEIHRSENAAGSQLSASWEVLVSIFLTLTQFFGFVAQLGNSVPEFG